MKKSIFGVFGAATISTWAYNRFFTKTRVEEFCIHEPVNVYRGFFYDTYYYEPNDSFLVVYGYWIRPTNIVYTKKKCFGFGEHCIGESKDWRRK